MTQEIVLVVPGTNGESTGRQAIIEPDTTVNDLLLAADLPTDNWELQIKQGDKLFSLQGSDVLSNFVEEGEKVFVFPNNMVVGAAR